MDDNAYYKNFHYVVSLGWCCGLTHPVEWMANAIRTPGGSLTPEYYVNMDNVAPRFLYEMFEDTHMRAPTSAQEILEWCDNHYANNTFMQGFFDYLKPLIEKYVGEKNKNVK